MKKGQKILLTGGTGKLGKNLIEFLSEENFFIDVLTRNANKPPKEKVTYINADFCQPKSLQVLKSDYYAIVHCASNPKNAEEVDIKGTTNLIERLRNQKVENFIYISIVGIDKTDFPYYKSKLRTEEIIKKSGLPYTILRVTQFHDFVYNRILNAGIVQAETLAVPQGLKFQSIDLTDVCEEILNMLKNKPLNNVLEIGGPKILSIDEILNAYVQIIAPDKKVSMIPAQNEFQKLFTTGINTCPYARKGHIQWVDFLKKKKC
ncbi:SDR family oxidoreductase [Zobellia galactanivorans]|uniref:SDR family oxidoreductase n=1 Tax=Zobellia galactanivorans (strain DSM 12802 / CCUG 47099 / CIP 106680 / NCIMB 13871 / Dsij) TaxID=63186 RepID=UPI001C07D1C8|nr:NAD(P)H-binding protein [Zobellia galactanivorans]MBU3026387.1 NAD(P)H-binding protein [Zobellia galactanivorans]